MNEKDDDIAHPGMLSKPEKHLILAQFKNSPGTRSPFRQILRHDELREKEQCEFS
jgi:hypothetical protein